MAYRNEQDANELYEWERSNGYHIDCSQDYESEKWAGEAASMRLEGMHYELEDLQADLDSGEISEACYLIRSRRIEAKYGQLAA